MTYLFQIGSSQRSRPLLALVLALCVPAFVTAQSQPPAVPVPVPAPELATALDKLEARKLALVEREAAALSALAPADSDLLQQLEAARSTGADPAMLEWEEQSLTWYAAQMAAADVQAGSQFPSLDAKLNVSMVYMQLAYTVTRPDTNQQFSIDANAPVLQVARAGSPVKSILWIPGFGYAAVPGEYVAPYIKRVESEAPLQIGSNQ